MAPWIIQIGENKVAIEGSEAFVSHIQRVVIEALQGAPLSGGPAGRGRRPGAKAKGAPGRPRTGKRPGRLPGRTVNRKYIPLGGTIPAGSREVNRRIVPIAEPPAKGGGRPPKRG